MSKPALVLSKVSAALLATWLWATFSQSTAMSGYRWENASNYGNFKVLVFVLALLCWLALTATIIRRRRNLQLVGNERTFVAAVWLVNAVLYLIFFVGLVLFLFP